MPDSSSTTVLVKICEIFSSEYRTSSRRIVHDTSYCIGTQKCHVNIPGVRGLNLKFETGNLVLRAQQTKMSSA